MTQKRTPIDSALGNVFTGLRYVIVGGVATRLYQPERFTKDVAILIPLDGLDEFRSRLLGANGQRMGSLSFPASALGLGGEVWRLPRLGELDLIWSDHAWAHEAVATPNFDDDGFAIIALPYLIVMKLDASRGVDQGDLSRMLGFADESSLAKVRGVVRAILPGVTEDLESYIEIGRLEVSELDRNRTEQ